MSESEDKQTMENLSGRALSGQEVFAAKQDLLGFFGLLCEIDNRINPQLYENYGSPNNAD